MRRLIVGGIVFLILLGVWTLYWHSDTKRFIQNLPKVPPGQHLESPPMLATTAINMAPYVPVVEVQEDLSPVQTPTSAKNTGPTAGADLLFEDTFVRQESQFNDLGISIELEVLFLGVHLFGEEISEVITILDPMINENISIMFRQQEISRELSSAIDYETEQALYEEREALVAKEEKLSPQIFALQDQRSEIEAERNAFLAEYGISSWQDFKEIHRDSYQTWKADQ